MFRIAPNFFTAKSPYLATALVSSSSSSSPTLFVSLPSSPMATTLGVYPLWERRRRWRLHTIIHALSIERLRQQQCIMTGAFTMSLWAMGGQHSGIRCLRERAMLNTSLGPLSGALWCIYSPSPKLKMSKTTPTRRRNRTERSQWEQAWFRSRALYTPKCFVVAPHLDRLERHTNLE